MKNKTINIFTEENPFIEERLLQSPLLHGISRVLKQVQEFKDRARGFYFDVLLSIHPCLKCGGPMRMTGQSQCSCSCGLKLDPTIEFQPSDCCNAKLVKKIYHYACSKCGQVVPSKFLFDERLFDPDYFRLKMAISRENQRNRLEAIQKLLAASHSQPVNLKNSFDIDRFTDLAMSLDEFIGSLEPIPIVEFIGKDEFRMEKYRQAILTLIQSYNVYFTTIAPLSQDLRKDKIWRFITLIYMEHDQEVNLIQKENDILVTKHEAYAEG